MTTIRRLLAAAVLASVAACADRTATNLGDRPDFAKGGAGGDPTVTGTSPTDAPVDTTLNIRVYGSNFDRNSRADLALAGVIGPKVRTNSTRYVSTSELLANVTIAIDADTGAYDVIVTTSTGKKGIGTEMFRVRKGPKPPPPPNPAIAFYDATNSGRFLYVMNADGSARTSVATLVDGGGQSTWSRAGNGTSTQPYQLAYDDLRGPARCGGLFIVDVWVSGTAVMASTPRQVSRSAPTCFLAWSPIGPELAYATGFCDGSVPARKEVWLIGASGTNERLLYSSTRALTDLDWSRDGTHLVVVEKAADYTAEGDRLLLIDVATGAGRTLYQSPVNMGLHNVDVGNTSNDVLFFTQAYSSSPTTSTPYGIYRLPVGADFSAGTPQLVVEAGHASRSPDDTKLVIQEFRDRLSVYTLATGTRTSIGNGSSAHWRPQ